MAYASIYTIIHIILVQPNFLPYGNIDEFINYSRHRLRE